MEAKKDFYETYLATKAHSAQTRTWIFKAYVHPQWTARHQGSSRQRALEPDRLSVDVTIVALNRALRLRKSSDFQQVRQQGRSLTSRLLILAWMPNNGAALRVGFVVSKRVSKHAVKRNYIKRLLTEAIRPSLPGLTGDLDIVFSARNQITNADLAMLTEDIALLLRRARLVTPPERHETSG